jgi:hypothetical protein
MFGLEITYELASLNMRLRLRRTYGGSNIIALVESQARSLLFMETRQDIAIDAMLLVTAS